MAFDGITIAAMVQEYIKIWITAVLTKLHNQRRMP